LRERLKGALWGSPALSLPPGPEAGTGRDAPAYVAGEIQGLGATSRACASCHQPGDAGSIPPASALLPPRLARGETIEQLLEVHPRLTRPAVLAALKFAAEVLRSDIVYPIADSAA